LNLDNVIPINDESFVSNPQGLKRRKTNVREADADEDALIGDFDLGEALRLVDEELKKEKERQSVSPFLSRRQSMIR
jgi:hypothetical protein